MNVLRHALVFLVLLAAIYALWLLVFWPGILGDDSLAIIKETLDPEHFSSGKTDLWYYFVRLFYLGHERAEVPVGVMLALGALMQARILGWCWSWGLRKTALFLLVFVALTPHFVFFLGTLIPDGIYAVAMVGLLFECWLIARFRRCGWGALAMVAVTLPFAAFARPNGIIFVVPVALLVAWLWRHERRDSMRLGVIVVAWGLVMGVGGQARRAGSQPAVYPLAIFETVNFLQPRPMNQWIPPRVSPLTIATLEKYHALEVYTKNYDPDYWDFLVFPENGPKVGFLSEADKEVIVHEFFRHNLWRNLPKFAGSRINIFLTSCLAQGVMIRHSYAKEILEGVQSKSTYRRFGLDRAEALLTRLYDLSYAYRWLFWTPFLGLGLMGWALMVGVRRRDGALLLVAGAMLVQLGGIVLFSSAGEYRYILPFFALPLALLPMYALHRREARLQHP